MPRPELEHLQVFATVARLRSLQGAARATGRSRTTVLRLISELEQFFEVDGLLQRAPGQRVGVLTPAGAELARRVEAMLEQWDRWWITTKDALGPSEAAVRVGTLPGSFDLIADLLAEVHAAEPDLGLRVVEVPDERLIEAIESGAVDLGFGTLSGDDLPPRVAFEALGPLPWAVIVPAAMAPRFPAPLRMRDLDGVPMVVTREGPARRRLERVFAEHRDGPLQLNPAFEVGSTPRLVEMVARGFGPALVSQFRLAFVHGRVEVRTLVDGPPPLVAGVYTRAGAVLSRRCRDLVDRARRRFEELSADARDRPVGARDRKAERRKRRRPPTE